jgi:F-type H+-transporting ATPase subunit epsilon
MSTFSLKIVACNRVFYDGECEILVFPAYDGEMAVMAHHEQMTATVEIGEIRFKLPDGTWQKAIVSDGLIKVDNNKVDVLVYSAERPEEIDEFRAEAALERAREQLQSKQSIMEYHISQASLSRAMARLKGAHRYSSGK